MNREGEGEKQNEQRRGRRRERKKDEQRRGRRRERKINRKGEVEERKTQGLSLCLICY